MRHHGSAATLITVAQALDFTILDEMTNLIDNGREPSNLLSFHLSCSHIIRRHLSGVRKKEETTHTKSIELVVPFSTYIGRTTSLTATCSISSFSDFIAKRPAKIDPPDVPLMIRIYLYQYRSKWKDVKVSLSFASQQP